MKRAFAFLLLLLAAPAQADFAAACAQTGVWYCQDFSSGVGGATITAGDTAGPGTNATTPTVENGMLRFVIPTLSGSNTAGALQIRAGSGQWVPGAIEPGETLYYAFRRRADSVATAASGWGRLKMDTLFTGSSPCTHLEIATTTGGIDSNFTGSRAAAYTSCGADDFLYNDPPLPDVNDFWTHYPDYTCTYRHYNNLDDTYGVRSFCARSEPGTWDDFYYEVELGTHGTATTQVRLWHRPGPGGPLPQVWQRWTDTSQMPGGGFTFSSGAGFNGYMLTTYMTSKNSAQEHATGHVDYDYLIMSTLPMNKTLLAAIPASGILPSVSRPQTRVCFSGMCINVVDDR